MFFTKEKVEEHEAECSQREEKVEKPERVYPEISREEAIRLWNDDSQKPLPEETEVDITKWIELASWGDEEIKESKEDKENHIIGSYSNTTSNEEKKNKVETEELDKKLNDLKFDDSSDSSDNE